MKEGKFIDFNKLKMKWVELPKEELGDCICVNCQGNLVISYMPIYVPTPGHARNFEIEGGLNFILIAFCMRCDKYLIAQPRQTRSNVIEFPKPDNNGKMEFPKQ